jgi:hypothetical protein
MISTPDNRTQPALAGPWLVHWDQPGHEPLRAPWVSAPHLHGRRPTHHHLKLQSQPEDPSAVRRDRRVIDPGERSAFQWLGRACLEPCARLAPEHRRKRRTQPKSRKLGASPSNC